MAKPTQVLHLEPSVELTFKGPFTEVVTSHLRLHNPSDRIVYFKVKTTAPKYYCVRPNSGIMKPNETAVISVMLQPVDQASTLESERTKHKFMIQTAFANSADTPVETFWKSADPLQVMDSKLRVHFVPGTESTAPSSSETVISDVKETTPVKAPSFGQKETDLRRRVEHDKVNLERENRELRDRLEMIAKSAQQSGIEGMPVIQVFLIALAALLVGLILGKLF